MIFKERKFFKNMNKNFFNNNNLLKISAISILLIMLICVMQIQPVKKVNKTGAAVEIDYTVVYNASNNTFYKNSPGGTVITADELELLKISGAIDATTGVSTLTLNGTNFKSTAGIALFISGNTTINVVDGTENTISKTSKKTSGHSCNIYSNGNITFEGKGTLNLHQIEVNTDSESLEWYEGIQVTKSVNIKDANINIYMKNIKDTKACLEGILANVIIISEESRVTYEATGTFSQAESACAMQDMEVLGEINVNIHNVVGVEDDISLLRGFSAEGDVILGQENEKLGNVNIQIKDCKNVEFEAVYSFSKSIKVYGASLNIDVKDNKEVGYLIGLSGSSPMTINNTEMNINFIDNDYKEDVVPMGIFVDNDLCSINDSNVVIHNIDKQDSTPKSIGIKASELSVSGGNVLVKATGKAIDTDILNLDSTKENEEFDPITDVYIASTNIDGSGYTDYDSSKLSTYKYVLIDEVYDYSLQYDPTTGTLSKVAIDENGEIVEPQQITSLTNEDLPGWESKLLEDGTYSLVLDEFDFATVANTGLEIVSSNGVIELKENTINRFYIKGKESILGIINLNGSISFNNTGTLDIKIGGPNIRNTGINGIMGMYVYVNNANIRMDTYDISRNEISYYEYTGIFSFYETHIKNAKLNMNVYASGENLNELVFIGAEEGNVKISDSIINLQGNNNGFSTGMFGSIVEVEQSYINIQQDFMDENDIKNKYIQGDLIDEDEMVIDEMLEAYFKIFKSGILVLNKLDIKGGKVTVNISGDITDSVGFNSMMGTTYTISLNDTVTEISAAKVMGVTPSLTNCAITEGRLGESTIVPGVVNNITTYDYAFIEPNYYLTYNSATGKMYINDTATEASVAGWSAVWDSNYNVYKLVLDGFEFSTSNIHGLMINGRGIVELVSGSSNTITVNHSSTNVACALNARSALSIQGEGLLNINNNYSKGWTYGIYSTSEIVVNDASLRFKADVTKYMALSATTFYKIENSKIDLADIKTTDSGTRLIYGITQGNIKASKLKANYSSTYQAVSDLDVNSVVYVKNGTLNIEDTDMNIYVDVESIHVIDADSENLNVKNSNISIRGKSSYFFGFSSSTAGDGVGHLNLTDNSTLYIDVEGQDAPETSYVTRIYGIYTQGANIQDAKITVRATGEFESYQGIMANYTGLNMERCNVVMYADVREIEGTAEIYGSFEESVYIKDSTLDVEFYASDVAGITLYNEGTIKLDNSKFNFVGDYEYTSQYALLDAQENVEIVNNTSITVDSTCKEKSINELGTIAADRIIFAREGKVTVSNSNIDVKGSVPNLKVIVSGLGDIDIIENSEINVDAESDNMMLTDMELCMEYTDEYIELIEKEIESMFKYYDEYVASMPEGAEKDAMLEELNFMKLYYNMMFEQLLVAKEEYLKTFPGNINIDSAIINVKGVSSGNDENLNNIRGVYASYGNIYITGNTTEITLDLSSDNGTIQGICAENGSVNISNGVNITMDCSAPTVYDIYAIEGITIEGSNISIDGLGDSSLVYGIYSKGSNINIDESDIEIKGTIKSLYGIFSAEGNINIDESDIDMTEIYAESFAGVYVYNESDEDIGNITITGTNLNIDVGNSSSCKNTYGILTRIGAINIIKDTDSNKNNNIDINVSGTEEAVAIYSLSRGLKVSKSDILLRGKTQTIKGPFTIDTKTDYELDVVSASTEYDGSILKDYSVNNLSTYKYMVIGYNGNYEYIYHASSGELYAKDSNVALTEEQLENMNISIIYDETAYILVMKGTNITTSEKIALRVVGDGYIHLEDGTVNSLVSNGATESSYYGIRGSRDLTLSGKGTLNLNKTSASDNDENYYGIYSDNDTVLSEDILNLSNDKLKVLVSNAATKGTTYGIYASNIYSQMANTSVQVYENNSSSYGLNAINNIAINNGQLEVVAHKVTNVVPTYTNVAITEAKQGATTIYPGVNANTPSYDYVMIQPNYYLRYKTSTEKMYISDTGVELNVSNWSVGENESGARVLKLNGLNFRTNSSIGLYLEGNTTIELLEDSTNVIEVNNYSTDYGYGINGSTNYNITGQGVLDIDVNTTRPDAKYNSWFVYGIYSPGSIRIENAILNIDVLGPTRAATIYMYGFEAIGATMNLNASGTDYTYNIYANGSAAVKINIASSEINGTVRSNSSAYGMCTKGNIVLDSVVYNDYGYGNTSTVHIALYSSTGLSISNSTIYDEANTGFAYAVYNNGSNNIDINASKVDINLQPAYSVNCCIYNNSGNINIKNQSDIDLSLISDSPVAYMCSDTTCTTLHYYNQFGIRSLKRTTISDSEVKVNAATSSFKGIEANEGLIIDNATVKFEDINILGYGATIMNGQGVGESEEDIGIGIEIKNGSVIDVIDVINMTDDYCVTIMNSDGHMKIDNATINTDVTSRAIQDFMCMYGQILINNAQVNIVEKCDAGYVMMAMYGSMIGENYNLHINNSTVNIESDIYNSAEEQKIIFYTMFTDVVIDNSVVDISGKAGMFLGMASMHGDLVVDESTLNMTDIFADDYAGIYCEQMLIPEEALQYGYTYGGNVTFTGSTFKIDVDQITDESYGEGFCLNYGSINILKDSDSERDNDIDINLNMAETLGIHMKGNVNIENGTFDYVAKSSVADSLGKGIFIDDDIEIDTTAVENINISGSDTYVNINIDMAKVAYGLMSSAGNIAVTNGANVNINTNASTTSKGIYMENASNSVTVTGATVDVYAGDNNASAIAIDTDNLKYGKTKEMSSEIIEASTKYKDVGKGEGYTTADIITYPGKNDDSYKYVKIGDVTAYSYKFNVDNGALSKVYTDGTSQVLTTLPLGCTVTTNASGQYVLQLNNFEFLTTAPIAIVVTSLSNNTNAVGNIEFIGTSNITLIEGNNTVLDLNANGEEDGERYGIMADSLGVTNIIGDGTYIYKADNKCYENLLHASILSRNTLNISLEKLVVKGEAAYTLTGFGSEKDITVENTIIDVDVDNVVQAQGIVSAKVLSVKGATITVKDFDDSNTDTLENIYGIIGQDKVNITENSKLIVDAKINKGNAMSMGIVSDNIDIDSSDIDININLTVEGYIVGLYIMDEITCNNAKVDIVLTNSSNGVGMGIWGKKFSDIGSTINIDIHGGFELVGIMLDDEYMSTDIDVESSLMSMKNTNMTIDMEGNASLSISVGIMNTSSIIEEDKEIALAGQTIFDGGTLNINTNGSVTAGLVNATEKLIMRNMDTVNIHTYSSNIEFCEMYKAAMESEYNKMVESGEHTEAELESTQIMEIGMCGNSISTANLEMYNTSAKVSSNVKALNIIRACDTKGHIEASTNYASLDSTPSGLGVVYDFDTNFDTYKYVKIDPSVITVDLTWGALDYEFDFGEWNTSTLVYDASGWKPTTEGGDEITISNSENSNVPIYATINYSQVEDYSDIEGTILNKDTSTELESSTRIMTGSDLKTYLLLTGELDEGIYKTKVGSVTILLEE